MKKIFSALALLVAAVPGFAHASGWTIDSERTVVEFRVKNMKVMNVKGTFKKVKGTANVDENDLTKSSVNAEIDARTIDTGNEKRDNHLRTSDFLDAGRYADMKFASNKMTVENNKLKINGKLTIHGTTRDATLDAGDAKSLLTDLHGKTRCTIIASTEIDRNEFGVNNGGVSNYVIGDTVYIVMNVEMVKNK